MTTEYYQIPSQQGFLPLNTLTSDPWLASATSTLSTLSIADSNTWGGVKVKLTHHPSLFEHVASDADAVPSTWNHVITGALRTSTTHEVVKAPIVPKQFHSTTSNIDAWSVVVMDNANGVPNNSLKLSNTHKRNLSNNKSALISSTSSSPTTDDKPIEDELSGQNRYKTELCKSFTETGNCRYGTKCQFAHGKEEIRPILRHPKYKTEICKTFHTTGTCPYGIRCRFIHTRSKEESMIASKVVKAVLPPVQDVEEDDVDDDGVVSLSHPPGIPVPQWSQSWNMAVSSPIAARMNSGAERSVNPEPSF